MLVGLVAASSGCDGGAVAWYPIATCMSGGLLPVSSWALKLFVALASFQRNAKI